MNNSGFIALTWIYFHFVEELDCGLWIGTRVLWAGWDKQQLKTLVCTEGSELSFSPWPSFLGTGRSIQIRSMRSRASSNYDLTIHLIMINFTMYRERTGTKFVEDERYVIIERNWFPVSVTKQLRLKKALSSLGETVHTYPELDWSYHLSFLRDLNFFFCVNKESKSLKTRWQVVSRTRL